MKLHRPIFSVIVILIQLILSIVDYLRHIKWVKANPEFCSVFYGRSFFSFILIIGICEMLVRPGGYKTAIRIFMVLLILGIQIAQYIPIDQFYFGVYNTAWFSAFVAVLFILFHFIYLHKPKYE